MSLKNSLADATALALIGAMPALAQNVPVRQS